MPNARTAKNAREKAAALRAEAERKAARTRVIVAGSIVLAVVIVIIGVTVLFRSLQQQENAKLAAQSAPPANLYTASSGAAPGILKGKETAKVTIDLYEDFQCPACRAFEEANRDQLAKWATDGTAKIVYHPIAFLDRASSTKYSTRAMNAAAAVLNSKPAAFDAFHKILFDNQPEEGGAGLPDAQLAELAGQAGADKATVAAALSSAKYEGWILKATEASSKAGVNSTPTVIVNGQKLTDNSPASLAAAVKKAAG